jgi:hypothetical protein
MDMYRALLPDCDWSFLRRRATHLSAKARENQRQQHERQQRGSGANDDDDVDLDRAVQAIHAVEDAMELLHDSQVLERQARIAQAAEARLRRQERQQDEAGRWSLVTPSEPDRDELRECIESSVPSQLLLKDGDPGSINTSTLTAWITTLMRDCQVHNWRELAMVQDDDTVTRIASKLMSSCGSNSDNHDDDDGRMNELKQHVYAWIDHAQGESVGEIMVEICDSNVAAVRKLEDRARSCTPKDLASWRAIPDLLLDRLQQQQEQPGQSDGDDDDDENEEDVTIDVGMLITWCDRSYNLLQEPQYAWLSWFATTVQ